MIDPTSLNEACLQAFGESLTFTIGKQTATITGVVTRAGAPVTARSAPQAATLGQVLGADDLLIKALSADIANAGIGKGSTVTVDGTTYKVIHPWPDNAAMTLLECRR